MEKHEADMLTPTALAFVGDAVHTLYVRRKTVEAGHGQYTLHVETSRYVNAKAQAAVYDALSERDMLTEEEKDIARRAKNAHLHSRAKTATPCDYHKATALESVIGYHELTGDTARRDELLEQCFTLAEELLKTNKGDVL